MLKYTIPAAIIIVILFFAVGTYIKKEWLDDGSVLTTSVKKSDAASRLSAQGGDLRIYEFTPETAPYMQCVFVTGTAKGSTFCFEKKVQ